VLAQFVPAGDEGKTLYLTAETGVYRARLNAAGSERFSRATLPLYFRSVLTS
jgi:hypothetical protein